MDLSVLIANHNTSRFLEVSLEALHTLTRSRFEVLINDDGSDPGDLAALEDLASRYPAVRIFQRPSERGGSYAHGEAVDFLSSQVDTPYTVVLDADCMPLMMGWDAYLIGELDDTTKIVGSRLGEGWRGNKPIDFPMPFLALFETETYHRLGISALPGPDARFQDTCWQWRPKYLEAGYRGKTLHAVNTRLTPEGPFVDVHCAVYYTHDRRLLGSHFGRGSNPGAKWPGRPKVLRAVRRRLGQRDPIPQEWLEHRERWLSKCDLIVRTESAGAEQEPS